MLAMGVGIDEVWRRMERHAGETFTQVRGGTFTYAIYGNGLDLDRTNQVLQRSQIEEAVDRLPLENTSSVHDLRGPSYLYAILMDPRISQEDW